MAVLFIVVANMVIKCLGMRFCEEYSSVVFLRLWEVGAVEIMFELPGIVRIYRRLKDKIVKDNDGKEIE